MMLKQYMNAEFINTSDDAYSEKILIGNGNAVIPYINIGMMPDNPIIEKQTIVDYSYYVFIGVREIVFNGVKMNFKIDFNLVSQKSKITEYVIVVGGKNNNGAELKISCESISFYVPETAKINYPPNYFVPVDTPKFKQNMNMKEVDAFFSLINLPEEIKKLIGDDMYSLQW